MKGTKRKKQTSQHQYSLENSERSHDCRLHSTKQGTRNSRREHLQNNKSNKERHETVGNVETQMPAKKQTKQNTDTDQDKPQAKHNEWATNSRSQTNNQTKGKHGLLRKQSPKAKN
jgi:hypothetical protein